MITFREDHADAVEILDAGFTLRVQRSLVHGGFKTLADLSKASVFDLLDVPNFGIVSLREVAERLIELDLPMDYHLTLWVEEKLDHPWRETPQDVAEREKLWADFMGLSDDL